MRDSGVSALAGQRLELAAMDRTSREFPIELTLQVSQKQQEVFHAFLHDISERLTAQRQLEHERTFLQALNDVGFTVAVAVAVAASTYWVSEAMGKLDYKDAGPRPDTTGTATKDPGRQHRPPGPIAAGQPVPVGVS